MRPAQSQNYRTYVNHFEVLIARLRGGQGGTVKRSSFLSPHHPAPLSPTIPTPLYNAHRVPPILPATRQPPSEHPSRRHPPLLLPQPSQPRLPHPPRIGTHRSALPLPLPLPSRHGQIEKERRDRILTQRPQFSYMAYVWKWW